MVTTPAARLMGRSVLPKNHGGALEQMALDPSS